MIFSGWVFFELFTQIDDIRHLILVISITIHNLSGCIYRRTIVSLFVLFIVLLFGNSDALAWLKHRRLVLGSRFTRNRTGVAIIPRHLKATQQRPITICPRLLWRQNGGNRKPPRGIKLPAQVAERGLFTQFVAQLGLTLPAGHTGVRPEFTSRVGRQILPVGYLEAVRLGAVDSLEIGHSAVGRGFPIQALPSVGISKGLLFRFLIFPRCGLGGVRRGIGMLFLGVGKSARG